MIRDFMTQAECADFLGCSRSYISDTLCKLDGFPRRRVGARVYVVTKRGLWKWLYQHPAGIAWREKWDKLGRLPRLDWDR